MRKLLLVLALLLAFALPATAAPHWPAGVAHAVGRTALNMVTFQRPGFAIAEWANVGAVVADLVTTNQALARCSTCSEAGNLLANGFGSNPRPAAWQFSLVGLADAFTEAGAIQYTGEQVTGQNRSRWWLLIPYALAAGDSALHARAAWLNSQLPTVPPMGKIGANQ